MIMIKKYIFLTELKEIVVNHKSQEIDPTIKYALPEELMDKRTPWWKYDITYENNI